MPILTQLYTYPIKSTAGIGLAQARVEPRGLQFDRRWMVVNDQGQFMTQRKFPKMALIQVTIDTQLHLNAPTQDALTLPLVPSDPITLDVEVWGDRCLTLSMGSVAQQWLSDFLQVSCQLVYMPDTTERPADHGKLGNQVLNSFADAYPFLLISEASLADLNSRLVSPVPINRFRPNLVVQDCEAFAEDTWRTIRIGEIVFQVAKACSRCSIPGVDQQTGMLNKEPLLTLAQYRRWQGEIWFGQNLVQEMLGSLKIGDTVEILSLKEDTR